MGIEIDSHTQSQLSAEELAAINDTPSDAELELLKAVAGGDDDAGDDDEGDDTSAAPAAAPAAPAPASAPVAATPAAEPAPAPAPAATAEPAPAPATAAPAPAPIAPAPVPTYTAALPDDFDARKTAAEAKEAEAWKKFRAGELDNDALQAELAAVSAERSELQTLQTKAEISREMKAQSAEQLWDYNIAQFMDSAKAVVDYRTDEVRAADLDLFVRALANDPKNATQPQRWFLDEAHKRVMAMHGLTPAQAPAAASAPSAPAAPSPALAAPAPAPAPATRKPDTSALPPSLAHVPGSDGPGDVGGEFADLDKLEGFELEDAIRRMTPAQRERYSRGQ